MQLRAMYIYIHTEEQLKQSKTKQVVEGIIINLKIILKTFKSSSKTIKFPIKFT